jgi:hypothetical protein
MMATTARAPLKTATQVAAAKPGVHRIDGAPGLYFKRGAAGAGSYFYRYSRRGEQLVMGLGPADRISLAEPKAKAIELTAQRNKDLDPIAERKRRRDEEQAQERAEAKKVTFAQAAAAYVDERAEKKKWRGPYAKRNWLNPLIKYAYPEIGRMMVDEIKVPDVRAVMRRAGKLEGGTDRRIL